MTMESWLSGRRRTIGNRVCVNSAPRVQIPNSPPNIDRYFDTMRIAVTVFYFTKKRMEQVFERYCRESRHPAGRLSWSGVVIICGFQRPKTRSNKLLPSLDLLVIIKMCPYRSNTIGWQGETQFLSEK